MPSSFYEALATKRSDSVTLRGCIEKTVARLLESDTNIERPGMLLGKIQSGKTRAFIGIIALAFDRGFDMSIVLTKGTKALAKQTFQRLRADFEELVEDERVQICDVMHLPTDFPRFVLRQKLIIVVKKETNNLRRIIRALTETYPDLGTKRVLIIDDEADYASVGFHRGQERIVEINRIPSQIDDLRRKVAVVSVLQVTATPYSLYLQPRELAIPAQSVVFKPVRPAFTEPLPEFPGYIGGRFYFEECEDPASVAADLYRPIPIDELQVLRKEDRRSFRIENALETTRIETLRVAIVRFVVGACIARMLQRLRGIRQKRYSFIVHTEHSRASHAWQERVVRELKRLLEESSQGSNAEQIRSLVANAFEDFERSLRKLGIQYPPYQEVEREVLTALTDECLMVRKVNSETEAEQLLDEHGQLQLTTPLNIFIGGQILDRGVTVDNLIGFYYGRHPQRYQQDTVLQHSRMYGNRPPEDLAVTRFYTAEPIYQAMKRIHEFDSALREAIENAQGAEVAFIRSDVAGQIQPCNPNKIMLSNLTTLRPFKRLVPYGFQTRPHVRLDGAVATLDRLLSQADPMTGDEPFVLDLALAKGLLDEIREQFDFEDGYEWDWEAAKAALDYLAHRDQGQNHTARIWCLVRRGREFGRVRRDGDRMRFFDAPDTSHVEGQVARRVAIDRPILMLFRCEGGHGWASLPFWWPVVMAPRNTPIAIFATESPN